MLGARGLAQNIGSDVVSKISDYGIGSRFHLLGPTRDISAAYDAFDVLAFPSHLKAAGRPVFEAAFAGRPGIVAVENPSVEVHKSERAVLNFADDDRRNQKARDDEKDINSDEASR